MKRWIGPVMVAMAASGSPVAAQTFENCRYEAPGADKRAYLPSETFLELSPEAQQSIVVGFFDGLMISRQFGMPANCVDEIWGCIGGTSPSELTWTIVQHLQDNPHIVHWPFNEAALDGLSNYCYP